MRKAVVAANWKMNGDIQLLNEFAPIQWGNDKVEAIFALPSILLPWAKFGQLAGQDVSAFASGAHTGEISATMLKNAGCSYVILGHSERRTDHHEDEALLIEKWKQAKAVGLKIIYCIGESLEEYEQNRTQEALLRQLNPILDTDLIDEETVIAYEPVWAIGTGKTATAEYAQKIHQEIRKIICKKSDTISARLRILYGGSVKADNAKELFSGEDIDGFLVGGASLKADSFKQIIEAIS